MMAPVSASVMPLAIAEREDFLDLLEQLRDDQWDAATLCEDWSVREVVAHVLSFEDLSRFAAVRLIIRGRIGRTPGNELAMAPYRQWSAARLTDRMSSHLAPTGLTSGFNGGIALADGMIHQQDIRRPLAIRRTIPPTGSSPPFRSPSGHPPSPAVDASRECSSSPPTSTGPTVEAPPSVAQPRPC